jgi:immunity protein, SdpI family
MRKWLGPLLIVAAVMASAIVYSRLPARVPVHWNVHGQVDRYGSRLQAAALFPLVMLGTWLLLRFLPRIDPRRMNYAKFADTYDLFVNSLLALFAVMHAVTLAAALGRPLPMNRVVPALTGILFIVLGNALPRARPNWWFGIRTPWTLSSDRVWMKTHRVGGYLIVAAGLLMLAAAAVQSTWTLVIAFAAILAAGFGSLVYSYFVWKEEHPQ